MILFQLLYYYIILLFNYLRWQKKISLPFISLHFFTIYNWYLNFEWQSKQHKCISPPNQTLVAYVCGLKLDVHLMFCNATSVGTVTSHFIRILHHQIATDSTNLEAAPAEMKWCYGQNKRCRPTTAMKLRKWRLPTIISRPWCRRLRSHNTLKADTHTRTDTPHLLLRCSRRCGVFQPQ